METILRLVSQYGYAAIFCALMFGIVGLPIPDETILTFSGYLISIGHLNFLLTLAIAWAGSMCGITLSYIIGRKGGLFLVHKYGRYVHVTSRHLERAHAWFERVGRWSLFFGYFMPGIRHFTAMIAGTSELDVPSFVLFAYSGALVWVTTFISLGYFLGEQWRRVGEQIHRDLTIAAIALTALLLLGYFLWRKFGRKPRRT
jgi:membrane protein DedA with SNARE-associated domain